MTSRTQGWLRGLLAAVLVGIGTGGVLVLQDPEHFSFASDVRRLLEVAGVAGLSGGLLYLARSPLPPDGSDAP